MDFTGKYELISSERFDDYLAAVGVSLIKRGVAATMKPTLEISQQGEKITIKTFSKLKNTEINFTPGVEFDEETADGRNAKSVVTVEGNKLIHVQKIGDEQSKTTREFEADKMTAVFTCKDAVATRVYKRSPL